MKSDRLLFTLTLPSAEGHLIPFLPTIARAHHETKQAHLNAPHVLSVAVANEMTCTPFIIAWRRQRLCFGPKAYFQAADAQLHKRTKFFKAMTILLQAASIRSTSKSGRNL